MNMVKSCLLSCWLLIFLPLALSAEGAGLSEQVPLSKKLSTFDLEQKKSGFYFTGLPIVNSNSIQGAMLGGTLNLFYNGSKTDEAYSLSAYKMFLQLGYLQTSKGTQKEFILVDLPFLAASLNRFRFFFHSYQNSFYKYFGIGTSSQSNLENKSGAALSNPYSDYYTYSLQQKHYGFIIDRYFLRLFRLAFANDHWGNELAAVTDSKLALDQSQGLLLGYPNNQTNYLRASLTLDWRNYEPNPRYGFLAELNYSVSIKGLGSDYAFSRGLAQLKTFWPILGGTIPHLTFAHRSAFTWLQGDVPYTEYSNLWDIDGTILGLGGPNTLRGYFSGRFQAKLMTYHNFELRLTLLHFHFLQQYFQIMIIPEFDVGRVWDAWSNVSLSDYKSSQGLGLRFIWNQATIMLVDYGQSREGQQISLAIGHVF